MLVSDRGVPVTWAETTLISWHHGMPFIPIRVSLMTPTLLWASHRASLEMKYSGSSGHSHGPVIYITRQVVLGASDCRVRAGRQPHAWLHPGDGPWRQGGRLREGNANGAGCRTGCHVPNRHREGAHSRNPRNGLDQRDHPLLRATRRTRSAEGILQTSRNRERSPAPPATRSAYPSRAVPIRVADDLR